MARITGLATGLDMDELVKESMKPYRIKIQSVQQQKDILEIKQKLYRDVIEDSRKFYDKYLDPLSSDSLLLTKNYSSVKFESKDSSVATATSTSSAIKDNFTVKVDKLATSASGNLSLENLQAEKIEVLEFGYNGKTVKVDIKDVTNDKELAKKINSELSNLGLKATYSDFTGNIVVESKETGSKIGENANEFTISAVQKDGVELSTPTEILKSSTGTNLEATITSSKGVVKYGDGTNGTIVSGKNSVTLDGVQFSLTDIGETRITGSVDVTNAKEKIVNFFNDYNTLIEKMNKLITDKKASGYDPLTDEQKEAMSESEIKLWNEKVEQGQLSRDSDLSRIVNSMKRAMTTMVSGTGLTLEKIGIEPVSDYSGTKNGTFKIDETKLTEALENNMEEIMTMFTQSSDKTGDEKYSELGIVQRLKNTIYDETVSISGALVKKAGVENSSTFKNNTLTKQMEKYSQKIEDLEKDFLRREQALYSKWALVEKAMNNYNSQQSYLTSQLS